MTRKTKMMILGNELLDRLFFLVLGMVIGLCIGWVSKAMRYAKEARDSSREALEKINLLLDKNETGYVSVTIRGAALFFVILLTALSAFITGISATRVSNNQAILRDIQECTERISANLITTINERTNYSGAIAQADKEQNKAFANIVTLSLRKTPVTKKQARQAVSNYQDKLTRYLNLIDKNERKRVNNPYPTTSDYRNCLQEAKEDN